MSMIGAPGGVAAVTSFPPSSSASPLPFPRVKVPPIDLHSQTRHSGVRLKQSCEPLSHLADFEALYLPEQLRAEQLEMEAVVRRTANEWAAAAYSVNGTTSTRTRYLKRHQFRELRNTHGDTMFEAKLIKPGQERPYVEGMEEKTSSSCHEEALVGGLPSWLRSHTRDNISIPLSTTHGTHNGVPSESSLLDQTFFNAYYDPLPPPTPASVRAAEFVPPPSDSILARFDTFSTAGSDPSRVRPLGIDHAHLRTKRVPLFATSQPSMFLQIPSRQSYPQFHQNSNILRNEHLQRRRREAMAQRRRRCNVAAPSVEEQDPSSYQSEAPLPPSSSSSMSLTAPSSSLSPTSRPSTSSSSSRSVPSRPRSAMPSFRIRSSDDPSGEQNNHRRMIHQLQRPPSASSASLSSGRVLLSMMNGSGGDEEGALPGTLTNFQRHMQRARQRWKEQGLIVEEEQELTQS